MKSSSSYQSLNGPKTCNPTPWIVGALVAAVVGGIVLVVVFGFQRPPVIRTLALQGSFAPYPVYTGSPIPGAIPVSASMVDFRFESTKVTIAYTGLVGDPACAQGVFTNVSNSCGIHFHAGTSCATHEEVMGHYYNAQVMSDPWLTAYYRPGDGNLVVSYGYTFDQTVGHTFVVHDKWGNRLSCELLLPQHYLKVNAGNMYPGYAGSLTATGPVEMNFQGTAISFIYNLSGADPRCINGPQPVPGGSTTLANSCGIHFHAGTSCADPSLVLGHWYNPALVSPPNVDPWTYAAYYTTSRGLLRFFNYGHTNETTLGKTFVIHDYDGIRITCDLVVPARTMLLTNFPAYPGYAGPITVTGSVNVQLQMTNVVIDYNLLTMDPTCVTLGPDLATPNSCGIHIHAGLTCSDANQVGGHFYRTPTDPWVTVAAGPGNMGTVRVEINATADNPPLGANNRAFVIHDRAGIRVTCNLLRLV